MDQLLEDFSEFDRKTLCSYLFREYTSNDEFKLWTNGLKPALMDLNIEMLEELMEECRYWNSTIKCRRCRRLLHWIPPNDETTNTIQFLCVFCTHSEPFLQCEVEETCSVLIDLMENNHPQIIASLLNLIFVSANKYFSISPPEIPDNPIESLRLISERYPNAVKLGGRNVVVLADIYQHEFVSNYPILYVADTVAIPTRYYMQALNYLNIKQTSTPKCAKNDEAEELTWTQECLLNELMDIANRVIMPGSNLILGRNLQHLILPDMYAMREHNFSIILPFDEVECLNENGINENAVGRDFAKIIMPVIKICNIVNLLVKKTKKARTDEEYLDALQKHLTTAIWLKNFAGTPFETLIYHILNRTS